MWDMVPTERGYKTAYAKISVGGMTTYSLLANETYPNKLFATRWNSTPGGIAIAGTNQRLSIAHNQSGFIDVSKAGNYVLSGSSFQYGEDGIAAFDICAFGDIIIATHKAVQPQFRSALSLSGTVKFNDMSAPPKANTCCVAANFVFMGNCGSWSTVTGASNILAWSAIGDHTNWTINPQVTQCSFAQFNDTPGAITCVRPFRDGIAVFKANSFYTGRYVGAGPNSPIWDFQRISDRVGCLGHLSITDIEGDLVFADANDIYRFDGSRPVSITYGIRTELRNKLAGGGEYAIRLGHDRDSLCVLFGTGYYSYVWNYRLNKWGKLYDGFSVPATYCQANTDTFLVKTPSTVSSGVQSFSTSVDHQYLGSLGIGNGTPYYRYGQASANGVVMTGVFGHSDKLQTVQRVNPVYVSESGWGHPTTATLTVYTGRSPTATRLEDPRDFTNKGQASLNAIAARFDTLKIPGVTANFFVLTHSCVSKHELVDLVPLLVPAVGER
jgi:hypothetical protein